MTELRRDAAYIRTKSHERVTKARATALTDFDKQVCKVLESAHTVTSVTKTLRASIKDDDLEERVADSMLRLLQAERIQLSPDS